MAKLGATLLIALSLGFAVSGHAQNLDMSASDQSSTFDQAGKPTRGMTQESVEATMAARRMLVRRSANRRLLAGNMRTSWSSSNMTRSFTPSRKR